MFQKHLIVLISALVMGFATTGCDVSGERAAACAAKFLVEAPADFAGPCDDYEGDVCYVAKTSEALGGYLACLLDGPGDDDTDGTDTADAGSDADDAGSEGDDVDVGPSDSAASCTNQCGVYDEAASCQCDAECVAAGDCCSDYVEVCSEEGSDAS